jgi:hypothetical protein
MKRALKSACYGDRQTSTKMASNAKRNRSVQENDYKKNNFKPAD